MNLHGIATRAVGAVNPGTIGDLHVADGGYTTAPDGTRVPIYSLVSFLPMQVQGMTSRDLAQADSLNMSGSSNTVYINGRVEGLVRSENRGGDLITFRTGPAWLLGKTWLVTGVLEHWPDWTKVAITLQNDPLS